MLTYFCEHFFNYNAVLFNPTDLKVWMWLRTQANEDNFVEAVPFMLFKNAKVEHLLGLQSIEKLQQISFLDNGQKCIEFYPPHLFFVPPFVCGCMAKKRSRYIQPSVRRKVLGVGKCCKCGATENLTVDHVYPFVMGGANTEPNLQCLCLTCNISKGAKLDDVLCAKMGVN